MFKSYFPHADSDLHLADCGSSLLKEIPTGTLGNVCIAVGIQEAKCQNFLSLFNMVRGRPC